MVDEKVNEREVGRDERIKAEMARIQKREMEEIRAQAEKAIEAQLAAEAEEALLKAQAVANAKAAEVAVKERAAAVKAVANGVAKWMIENDIENPHSVPGVVCEELRRKAGL
jgi:hypothetical protein